MRVGLVCPYDMSQPGGVQQVVDDFARHLRVGGDQTVVVAAGRTAFDGGPGGGEEIIPAGRPFLVKANASRAPLTLSPASWFKVRAALSGVDIVHIHEPFVPLVGWVAQSVRKPLIVTFHADAPRWVEALYRYAPLIGRVMRRSQLTAVSETAATPIPAGWGPVTIIPNAMDIASFNLPVGRVERHVAFLGRDDPRKGLDVLLESWAEIRAASPEAELLVMGAERLEPVEGVTYMGRVSNGEKRRILASSQVYVAPNTGSESFGIVLAEAMAAGCAVVASDLPSFVAVTGGAARIVPVGDVVALTSAVSSLLNDPKAARQLGDSGRRQVERYDWSQVLGQYRDAYRRALIS